MKLISMTDFVLEQNKKLKNAPDAYDKYCRFIDYARFLKQPLKLEMFVPCDEEWNVLDTPTVPDEYMEEYSIYREAKEKVLFEEFEVRISKIIGDIGNKHLCKLNKPSVWADVDNESYRQKLLIRYPSLGVKIIEDLIDTGITLTPSAIKKLGL